MSNSRIRYLIPLGIFIVLVALLGYGLKLDPRKVPSPLIGKPAPEFSLPTLQDPNSNFSPSDMKGKVWLINLWATWCVSCRAEHHVLNEMVREHGVAIVGLDYKDDREAALNWLLQLGNPYLVTVFDADGRIGIDWGITGTPETFIIDKKGIIRYKHIGPVGPQDVQTRLLPLIRQLEAEDA
jgi:cytochrome c biogenesis protein CcmG/thiol:disulfide interchange protein DsbE